jgi:hypothetical protein
MSKSCKILLLLGVFALQLSCNRQLSGQEAKDFILNPENELSRTVQLRGQNYRLSYWPKALTPVIEGEDLLYFELTSQDGKNLFGFSEMDFQLKEEGTYIPASIVLPENFGSSQNHLLIGFSRVSGNDYVEIQVGDFAAPQLIRFNTSNIKKINKRTHRS